MAKEGGQKGTFAKTLEGVSKNLLDKNRGRGQGAKTWGRDASKKVTFAKSVWGVGEQKVALTRIAAERLGPW